MNLRDRLGISPHRQRQLTWFMQICLIGMLFVGIYEGNTGIIVNAALALAVTQLPSLLERDFGIPMDSGLVLWITASVFLHVFGNVGLPGATSTPYQSFWWWDHLTHALSASIVAAVGYAGARAIDEHRADIYFPPRFMFVFILLFVLAAGVFWEVIEFAVSRIASVIGTEAALTQYGFEDTMLDLIFNTIGAVIAATWGTAYLTDIVSVLTERLDARETD